MAKKRNLVAMTPATARRVEKAVRLAEPLLLPREGRTAGDAAPFSAHHNFVRLTSLTQTSGRYPGKWCQWDSGHSSFADVATVWVVEVNGNPLALSTYYWARLEGDVSGVTVYGVSDVAGAGGGITYFTETFYHLGDGDWTKPAGLQMAVFEVFGAGGGGGGATGGSGRAVGGGGGGGAYFRAAFKDSDLPSTVTIVYGAGGTGGVGGTSDGTDGGDSSIDIGGGPLTAEGGKGAITAAAASVGFGAGGAGGGAGAYLPSKGQNGGFGFNAGANAYYSGAGGRNGAFMDTAGTGANHGDSLLATSANGNSSDANSACGGGGAASGNGSNYNGGAGGDGFLIITEYF